MQAGCKNGREKAPYPFVPSSLETPRNDAPSDAISPLASPSARFDQVPDLDKGTLSLERVTGILSAACAIHCLLMPLVVALLPLVGTSGVVLSGTTELLLSLLVLGSGSASLVLGYRRHRDLRIASLISTCLVLYLIGHAHESAWYGTALAVVAGLGLAGASFWSARLGHLHSAECAH
jgi:hypothetical protein